MDYKTFTPKKQFPELKNVSDLHHAFLLVERKHLHFKPVRLFIGYESLVKY
jgi:hypothetical protein